MCKGFPQAVQDVAVQRHLGSDSSPLGSTLVQLLLAIVSTYSCAAARPYPTLMRHVVFSGSYPTYLCDGLLVRVAPRTQLIAVCSFLLAHPHVLAPGCVSTHPRQHCLVKGESHPQLEVLVVVSIVKSRQVSEVKKKKFSKATSVSGGGKGEGRRRNRSAISLFLWPCQRDSGRQGGWGGGGFGVGVGGGHPRPSLPTLSREEWASKCYSHL